MSYDINTGLDVLKDRLNDLNKLLKEPMDKDVLILYAYDTICREKREILELILKKNSHEK